MNARDMQWLGEMAHEQGTPLWVLLSRVPQARYFELQDAFKGLSRNVHICYSVKTNPHAKIVEALDKMKSGFECVSLRELVQVKNYVGKKVFNSCASTEEELREVLEQNALIVIDSLSQAQLLSSILENKPLDVGLRVRFDPSKFGFSPNEVKSSIEELEKMGLSVTVLHAHPGTNCSLNAYRNFITKLAALVIDLPVLKGLDIGGGIPGKTNLVERKESLDQYAQVVREQLGEFLRTRELYLECGRFLVEDSMILVSKVLQIKSVDNQPFALLEVGINVLPRISMSPFRFFALTQSGGKKQHFRLGGPLMFGSDELGQVSAALERGDLVAVENTGAYCTELAWNLSVEKPKIVCVE